ncbi:reverse transcriptase domain-containing protein [Flavobacterium oreochromis]|uniref:Reverse transcriptase domain-containing protein n=1 Tax=Flavobacterium oreochromis TaxID=2906078 RepID=A0ABW8P9B6_9FLAO|nr:reverse transcriptase domain-containing protein [Flavobacterium oreochromis]OWP75249.1 RNA-directed DNA polymerase (Reverse transcriptase) [Flavobacterium oreochromis]
MIKTKDWFKDRGYPHFTNKTPQSIKYELEKYITNSKKIAKHSFSPLIFKEIKQRRYKTSNFNGIEKRSHKKINKKGEIVSNAKIREILYATHIDAHIYSYYTQKIISPKYEAHLCKNLELSKAITAYRQILTEDGLKFKNNVHFAKDIFDEIKSRENCVVLAFDIKDFFPSLNHKKLKLIWAKILGFKTLPEDHYNIFKASTNFTYVKLNDLRINKRHFDEKKLSKLKKEGKHSFFENIKELIDSDIIIHKNQKHKNGKIIGIPQGLPISALLANIYMLPFDEAIIEDLVKPLNVFYRRYSDDIIVICNEKQVETVESFVLNKIKDIDLVISREKTEKTLFRNLDGKLQSYQIKGQELIKNIPLNYLGFEFYGNKTLVKSKNLASFYREMKQAIKRKSKRIEKLKEKKLLDESPLFKRKIYRLYSYKGVKSRLIPSKKSEFRNGKLVVKNFNRKFRGNYIKYIYKASDEMNAPEIKKQIRNHWKILQRTLNKYIFSNVKKES